MQPLAVQSPHEKYRWEYMEKEVIIMNKRSFKDAGIKAILIKIVNNARTTIIIYEDGSIKEYRSRR